MEKSYSDFAKELGVSKQKLNYYVNDENKEKIFIKKGNKIGRFVRNGLFCCMYVGDFLSILD